MKKVVLSCSLLIGCGLYGFASNSIEIKTQIPQKEVKNGQTKKVERYDFSLFRFVKPHSQQLQEKDSTKTLENQAPLKKDKDATTYHYEKPLELFKFS